MEILRKETYVRMIENAVGSRQFNSIVIRDDSDEVRDLLNDGEFSCAVFVSSTLLLNQLVARTRTTVNNLELDLDQNERFEAVSPDSAILPGDVIFWEKVRYEDGSENRHVGFAVGNDSAVSTNYIKKCVTLHPLHSEIENTGEIRKIEKVFRYKF